jgi:TolB-like protein
MKKYLLIPILFFCFSKIANAQVKRLAILDFENISGIAKYDGLGKAMSSMLITDIEANVSQKHLQLVERAQIQKILKEQNFQASAAVDKSSSVKAGKLLGVKYLLVGDIYILNDVLVINARLTDTETGDIKFSKKQEGKLASWLNLKTNIAKDLATAISMPFTEPTIADKEVNVATITTFGNAITAKDEGKLEKAEELISTVNEFSPDFKYSKDLKIEIDQLKKEIADLKIDINEAVENPYSLALSYLEKEKNDLALKYFKMSKERIDVKDNFKHNKNIFTLFFLAFSEYNLGNYQGSLNLIDSCLKLYPYFNMARLQKIELLCKMGKIEAANKEAELFTNKWEYPSKKTLDSYASFNFIGNQLHDGFRNNEKEYTIIDIYIGNKGEAFNETSNVLSACEMNSNSKKSIFELEMQRLKIELLKVDSNFQNSLNSNYFWIGSYFSLVNTICWDKIKNKQFKDAKVILLENIYYLSHLEPNSKNTDYHSTDGIIPEMTGENAYLNYKNPDEVLGYLIGNLALCYAFEKDFDKMQILYSVLGYASVKLNGITHVLYTTNDHFSGGGQVNYQQIFKKDCIDLGIKIEDFDRFNEFSLRNKTIVFNDLGIKLVVCLPVLYDIWQIPKHEQKKIIKNNLWFENNSMQLLTPKESLCYELYIDDTLTSWKLFFGTNSECKLVFNDTTLIMTIAECNDWYENLRLIVNDSQYTKKFQNDFLGFYDYSDAGGMSLNVSETNLDKLFVVGSRFYKEKILCFRKK